MNASFIRAIGISLVFTVIIGGTIARSRNNENCIRNLEKQVDQLEKRIIRVEVMVAMGDK